MKALFERYGPRRVVAVMGATLAACSVLTVLALALTGGSDSRGAAAEDAVSPGATNTEIALPTATPEASPTPILHAGLLDGVPMSPAEWEARKDRLPLAVMVDNTTGAYPHAGLDRADLVYEAFVEGGLTRLMAVYWRQDAAKIVPVRSARTPFVVWASELGAMYAHAGGAQTDNEANAIGQIFDWNVPALSAFAAVSNTSYYRDRERRGPYDLATSTAALLEAASRLGYAGPPLVEPWKFREPGSTLPPGQAAGGIEIDFSGRMIPWQYIQWKWDVASGRYLRFQFGREHRDAVSGRQLAFATVIVMETEARVVDDSGHVLLEQLGEGPATVFTAGRAFEGVWKKADRSARTRFYDAARAEIVFERGPVFIEVIGGHSRFVFVGDAGGLPAMPAYEAPPPGSATFEPEPTPAVKPTTTREPVTPTPPRRPSPGATSSPAASSPPTSSPAAPTATSAPQ